MIGASQEEKEGLEPEYLPGSVLQYLMSCYETERRFNFSKKDRQQSMQCEHQDRMPLPSCMIQQVRKCLSRNF